MREFSLQNGFECHCLLRASWQIGHDHIREGSSLHVDLDSVWGGGENLEKSSRKSHPVALTFDFDIVLLLLNLRWLAVGWNSQLKKESLKEIMTCAKKPFSHLYQFICSFLVCHSAKMKLMRWLICCIYHGPPKPTFLEGVMENNLVFRWPKPLSFMVLGAHGSFIFMFEIPFHPSHPFRGPIGLVSMFDTYTIWVRSNRNENKSCNALQGFNHLWILERERKLNLTLTVGTKS